MNRKKNKVDQTEHTAFIESLSHDGKGVAHINDKTIFIQNALPNEEVKFIYTKKLGKFDIGKATEILKESPDRTKPKCKLHDICGGCSLQHLDHQKQMSFKIKTIQEQLTHIGNINTEISQPITGPIYGYRNKARLSVKYVQKKQKLLVGFHEKNGRYVTETKECPILNENIGKKISIINELIDKLSISQEIPQIEMACGDEVNALVLRNFQDFSDSDIELIKEFGDTHDIHFYSQSGGIDTVKPITTDKTLSYHLPDQKIEITFMPTDFTQINCEINKKLVNLALRLVDPQPNEKILDLFCGIGNFTLPIAKTCKSITGVEGSKSAIIRAQQNAENNNVKNANFLCADLTKDLSPHSWSQESYNKILLDPPRTGAQEICSEIKKFGAAKIIYVSCNPATLARDAKTLVEQGYNLESITPLDMYPHTSHIEVIAEFVRT